MTATAARNDTASPVETFREAATLLRRPFTPAAVKFKMQATWPKNNPTGGLIVAYIDARLAVERLNLIVPHLWFDEYEPLGKTHLICKLTVDGITRQDVGEGQGKGLYSDALKRAAVKFGIGVSLYAIPKMMVNAGEHAKQKPGRDGLTLELTHAGQAHVRGIYERWLEQHGNQAFGHPLDHGDVAGAQGDAEVDESHDPLETGEAADPEDIKELQQVAKGLTVAQVKGALAAAGVSVPDPFSGVTAFNAVPKSQVAKVAQALAGVTR